MSTEPPVMLMYSIYARPLDLPDDAFVVRRFIITPGCVEPDRLMGAALSLEEARSLVPPEADTCIPRSPGDDPTIVETWL